jgi:glycosyltransferase involved in cell wall biosynthesis
VGDFEVFVVDDGSPEPTAVDVVRAFRDARLHCIRLQTSSGPGAARNAGLLRASAPYIAFLDDDDAWLPEKLEVQLGFLDARKDVVGGVYSARITVDELAGTTTISRSPQKKFDIYSGENPITTSTVVVRRQCLDVVGLFDETLFSGQDFDLWIRLGRRFDLVYLDRPLVRYFVHQGYRITDDDVRKAHAWELLFAKHRHLFKKNRRAFCLMYVNQGLRYRRLGNKPKAHHALYEAFRLWPLELRVYWAFIRRVDGRKPSAVARHDSQTPGGPCAVVPD